MRGLLGMRKGRPSAVKEALGKARARAGLLLIRHGPCASCSWRCQSHVDTAIYQANKPRPATLPLFPGDGTQPSSGPLFQGVQHRRGFAETKVAAPSNEVDGQLFDNLREAPTFRQRSQEALRLKAARGDLHTTVAIGYRRGADDRLEQDPDRRICEALSLVFRKFAEIGSVRQLALWLRQEGIELPTAVYGPQGRTAQWGPPRYHALHRLLTNPIYAGAYVFGRTASRTRVEDGRKAITHGIMRRREEWRF